MTAATQDTTGVLLAGGQSRRMFAREAAEGASEPPRTGDKGLLDIAGKPMLAHVIARLAPQVGAMVINANGDPARFARFGLPVVADTIAGFVGPLAGVLAGLRWSAANAPAARAVVTVSTDAPFLPADLVTRLRAAVAERPGSIAIAKSCGELHPVIGLWPVALADDLEAALEGGVRKVLRWTDRHGTVPVEFPLQRIGGREVDPFFNANTPAELEEARALIATRPC
jgi:molybdopterin-guanine dinucleotide biosynthesis protein A